MRSAISIDIGGTKIAAGKIDEHGNLSHCSEIPSIPEDSEGLFQAVVELIDGLLDQLEKSVDQVMLGIGVPGLVDTENGIAVFQNNLSWRNFPLVERLRAIFPDFGEIVIENDVYQAAYAEWKRLEMSRESSLAFFTVSTGISSPILVGGHGLKGQGFAGEIGLIPVYLHGKTYRLEEIASGPAIAGTGQRIYGEPMLTTAEVFRRYYAKENQAINIIEDAVEAWTQGIYALISMVDPTKIILGGSVLKKNSFLLELIKQNLKTKMISLQEPALEGIMLSQYNNNAGLIGAGLRALA